MGSIRKQLSLWLVAAVVGLFALAAAFCYAPHRVGGRAAVRPGAAAAPAAVCGAGRARARRQAGGELRPRRRRRSSATSRTRITCRSRDAAGRTLRRSASLRGHDSRRARLRRAGAVLGPDAPRRPARPRRAAAVRAGVETEEEDAGDGANAQAEGVARVDAGADVRPDPSRRARRPTRARNPRRGGRRAADARAPAGPDAGAARAEGACCRRSCSRWACCAPAS